jgi:hypothetical protein
MDEDGELRRSILFNCVNTAEIAAEAMAATAATTTIKPNTTTTTAATATKTAVAAAAVSTKGESKATKETKEEADDVAVLRAEINKLKCQLSLAAASGGAAMGEDMGDWDGTLEHAKQKLFDLGQVLMSGDETVQHEFDRWDRLISNHPETLEAKQREAEEWERVNRPLFEAAMQEMRGFVPSNIALLGAASLQEQGERI